MRICIRIALLLITSSTLFSQDGIQQTLQLLDNDLEKISEVGLIKGYGVAIVSKDSTLFAKGYGLSDVESGTPYTINTLQNIGSVSKTLIGVALLKAQEMGKLNLNDPINKHLDFEVINPSYKNDPILIWHLATHTGTINDTGLYDKKAYYLINKNDLSSEAIKGQSEEFQTLDNKVTMKEYLENFLSTDGIWYGKKNFVKKKPGTKYEYSNVGATLAAQVLEEATEMSYDEFTQQYILTPLRMKSSGWSFDTIDKNQHSKLYNDRSQELPNYSLVTYPDGGLITNLMDFSAYLSELMKGYYGEGTLLKKESYTTIFDERLPKKTSPKKANSYDDEFNSGIFMGYTPKGYLGHTGSDPGISSFMFFDPELQIGHIVMLNTSLYGDAVNQQLIPILKAVRNCLYPKK